VLALGKAATAMLAGCADALGARLGPALAVTRPDAVRPGEPGVAGARVLFGDHPVPGAASLAAGARIEAFCDAVPAGGDLLVLLSGGASALAERLPGGVAARDLERANRWLLASGLPIGGVNAVRACLSCLKAGRLATRLAGRRVFVLAVSDVPGDEPGVIGSGPLTVGPPPALPPGLPSWLEALAGRAPPPPAPEAPGLPRVDYRVVACARDAAQAAVRAARAEGVDGVMHPPVLRGEVDRAAERIMAELGAGPAGFHAWWGETTLRLPERPGEGGRNRHLALLLARRLSGRDDVTILCAATDGSDGSAGAAGGWADGGTVSRGRAAALDPDGAVACADAGTFLRAAGDEFVTGPTGTNVMDLVLALRGFGLSGRRRGG